MSDSSKGMGRGCTSTLPINPTTAMAAPEVLLLQPSESDQNAQQLVQQLRRNLNRLSDINRATRLHGVEAILALYTAEASRRVRKARTGTEGLPDHYKATGSRHKARCAFSEVFLCSVYNPVLALCVDEASESCRDAALQLMHLLVSDFLSFQDVVALCSGNTKSDNEFTVERCCKEDSHAGLCYNQDSHGGLEDKTKSNLNSEAAKSIIITLCGRLKSAPGVGETSEELRGSLLKLLQRLLSQYAADPPSACEKACSAEHQHEQLVKGWNATLYGDYLLAAISGALRDKSPSNAIEACRLLSAISRKIDPSLLLQVGRYKISFW